MASFYGEGEGGPGPTAKAAEIFEKIFYPWFRARSSLTDLTHYAQISRLVRWQVAVPRHTRPPPVATPAAAPVVRTSRWETPGIALEFSLSPHSPVGAVLRCPRAALCRKRNAAQLLGTWPLLCPSAFGASLELRLAKRTYAAQRELRTSDATPPISQKVVTICAHVQTFPHHHLLQMRPARSTMTGRPAQ